MALDFFAGCVGGCAGVLVGHPFDTIKVRLQTQDPVNPRYKGTLHCLRAVVREEKVRGLYRGVTSPLAGVSLVNALVFGVYGNVQRALGGDDGLGPGLAPHALAGAAAGAAQSLICSPVELAKTRLQLQTRAVYRSPIDCLQKVWACEGTRGVFRGLGLTLLRELPGCALYFAAYEALTHTSSSAEPVSTGRLLLAGGLAGTASWVLTYPVDVIKSRVQADGLEGPRRYRGAWHCLRASLAGEGPRFLGQGLSATVLRAFPTNAATFAVVAWTFRILETPLAELRQLLQDLSVARQASTSRAILACQCPLERLETRARLLQGLHCNLCAADT